MSTQIVVPDLGESVVDATIARWLKQEGESVSAGEAVLVLETDKVDLEVAAEKSGVLKKIERQAGEDVQVGDVLGVIDETAESDVKTPLEDRQQAEAPDERVTETAAEGRPQAAGARRGADGGTAGEKVTPVARRLAREHDVDLSQVVASSATGRVTKGDVQRFLTERPDGDAARQERATEAAPEPRERSSSERATAAAGRSEREERVRLSRRRRTIAQRLVEAQHTAAMLTTFNEIDMSAVMDVRLRRKESFRERHGVGLGLSSFFVKTAIGALKDFPRLNAEIDGDEMILKHYYDIGIAIGASEGLVVPVLRDADRMSFAEIERRIKEYAQQAEDGTLALEDLRGGTFTITNGGVFGSMLSTPILNAPQVGILGLHKIEQRPIALEGAVVIHPMMYVALSYDHRIVDGREAVQFLVRLKALVEDPEALLLEG